MPTKAERLDRTFGALADPTRRAILARLAQGEATVNELAEPFPISVQAVSKHLKVLERAGLIVRGREAQWRPCRLDGAPLKGAAEWLQGLRMKSRRDPGRRSCANPPGAGACSRHSKRLFCAWRAHWPWLSDRGRRG